ncbi:protein FAR1-RELATED SEQUENCE 4-like [Helianthus annuus]|uniref:protein FAR1-RELATED SEQUENCE 4-like n=1 Tax=Helianthus annuus TaxID=4232 RepID=UPI00165328FE|nr:protein FAR1-RELATED SEQUENCE 4-like [Helianthus annuus]
MYVKYAKECGFSVRKGTTKTNSKGMLHIKYFLCMRAGVYKDKKVDTLDPNQKERVVRSNFSKRTDCGALLCVEYENGFWKVYKFVEEHNHELVERPNKHFLPTKRHLTQLQKHVIHSISKLNLGPVKAFNVMMTCFGGFEVVGASKVEFKNYKRQINLFIGEYDADMVVKHLNEKKHSQPNFSYSMVFVPFTGIDNHHCNVTFGAALLASETADTYIWLLRVFLKAVGSKPKLVVTNQDPAMKKAISAVFVDTRHRLCMWHVMHKLSPKVGVRLCNSTNFKERICGVVWTDILTPEEESWIPAYYRMEPMSGLMRTTSRSESENHFFGQLKSSYKVLEGQAVDIYTKSIFCDVQAELIGVADCVNQRYEDKHSMHGVIEILFLAFFREFPKQYILDRWRKEASPNCSPEFSISREYMTEPDPDVQSMMRDVIYSTKYTLNRLSGNKEELSLYKDHVQSYMKKVQDMQIVAPPASSRDRFAEITGQYKNGKNPMRVHVGYKSKGSGTRKRLKSKQEIAVDKKKSKSKPGAKERQCQNCKAYGHYASTCKQATKSLPRVKGIAPEMDYHLSPLTYAKECGFSVRKGTTKTNSKEYENGFWKVYKFVEEHNHELVERPNKHFLPTKRHLTQLQKHVIHSISKLNLGPVKAFNVMKTCFGGFEVVGASKVEFKNYKRQINMFIGEYDADMVVKHLNEKKHSQPNFSYSMVFVPFTGIDNHHCNVTFGATLLASKTADTYIWLLRVFLKAVGSKPKVVVTDQDPAMKKAISAVGVRLCNSTNFKERICGVVWTDILTPEEFELE